MRWTRELLRWSVLLAVTAGVTFPLTMVGVPSAALFAALVDEIAAELAAGRGVAVHCRAGIGRSGMVALRLMIEAGEAPDDALARLRTVRPCGVETTEQMHWAMSAPRQAALFLRHGD